MDDVRPVHAAATETGASQTDTEKILEKLEEKKDVLMLGPALTADQLYQHCLTARARGFGSVVVRPCDADSALRFVGNGGVQVASVVGYPFGGNASAVKQYECRDLLRRGVRIIHAYPCPGRLHSRHFQYQET